MVINEQVIALGTQPLDFSAVDCLPERIRQLIGDPMTFSDPVKLEEILQYTTSNSRIAKILHENPASDDMLRIVYNDTGEKSVTQGLDYFLSRSLSGQALRDRLEVCSGWLAENCVKQSKKVVDFGGGSGSYAFEALSKQSTIPESFVWECIDLDPVASECGKKRALESGMHNSIHFRQANFMSEKSVGTIADYGVLIGVLCGMDKDTAINCLQRCKLHLKKGGELLTATLLKRSFEEDPHTFRILCNVGGWQLRPKQMNEIKDIFNAANYEIIDIFHERQGGNGQYAIIHAKSY
jgi:hypothetical protein